MVTASETHQPGTETEREREREREKRDREKEKRSGESEVPRSDQSSQAFRGTRSGTMPPTTTQWTTCCYQAGLQEYRLNRDGIYRVLYM